MIFDEHVQHGKITKYNEIIRQRGAGEEGGREEEDEVSTLACSVRLAAMLRMVICISLLSRIFLAAGHFHPAPTDTDAVDSTKF